MAALPRLLFFYGTLMSGGIRDHVIADCAEPIGHGAIRGDLYVVGGGSFPAYVHGDGVVHGEVWQPFGSGAKRDDNLRRVLEVTDLIEGYDPDRPSSMYLREAVDLLDGRRAWTYRWNSGVRGLLGPIRSGSWREWTKPVRRRDYCDLCADDPRGVRWLCPNAANHEEVAA